MKSSLSFLLFLLIGHCLMAQVPNGFFENWELSSSGHETPVFWQTNNAPCCSPIEKAAEAIEGNFSMKVSSTAPSFEGTLPGRASTTFAVDQSYEVLQARLTIDSIEQGQVFIYISEWRDDNFENIGTWVDSMQSTAVRSILIPIAQTTMDSLKIEIIAANTMGPLGSEGYAEMVIDELTLSETTSLKEKDSPQAAISIYPNPSNAVFYVQSLSKSKITQIKCYNTRSELLLTASDTSAIDLSNWPDGLYLLQVELQDGQVYLRKVNKQ